MEMGDRTHCFSRVVGNKSTTAASMHSDPPGKLLILQTNARSAGSYFARPFPTVIFVVAVEGGTGILITTF
jgi:hypothetical protein